jgi:hypothetical protein
MRSLNILSVLLGFTCVLSAINPQGSVHGSGADYGRVSTTQRPPSASRRDEIPDPLYGVTVTDVSQIDAIVDALRDVKGVRQLTTRVVFDPSDNAAEYEASLSTYKQAVDRICDLDPVTKKCRLSYVVGLLADSTAMFKYVGRRPGEKLPGYQSLAQRASDFMDWMGDSVQIWEIGNEVNGEWTGWVNDREYKDPDVRIEDMAFMRERVAREVAEAFRVVHARGGLTALTLLHNNDLKGHTCYEDKTKKNIHGTRMPYGPDYSMLDWAKAYIPEDVRAGLDYVFISYYENEKDCPGLNKDAVTWYGIFKELAAIFPNAKLGFGETGFKEGCDDARASRKCIDGQPPYVTRYYSTINRQITDEIARHAAGGEKTPYFVGGYFYWYFAQDMSLSDNPARVALKNAIRPGP